ncbi:MAG: hypothetical protein QG586_385 [Pseudomonadota bacterium]|nr:hypothetical protein [Pseudomonadota bacterium]
MTVDVDWTTLLRHKHARALITTKPTTEEIEMAKTKKTPPKPQKPLHPGVPGKKR